MYVRENKINISFESEDNFKLKVKILCKSLSECRLNMRMSKRTIGFCLRRSTPDRFLVESRVVNE